MFWMLNLCHHIEIKCFQTRHKSFFPSFLVGPWSFYRGNHRFGSVPWSMNCLSKKALTILLHYLLVSTKRTLDELKLTWLKSLIITNAFVQSESRQREDEIMGIVWVNTSNFHWSTLSFPFSIALFFSFPFFPFPTFFFKLTIEAFHFSPYT